MINQYAPVILFGYKRLDKITAAIAALEECEGAQKTDLIIFADGYKSEVDKPDVLSVQKYISVYAQESHRFHSVVLHLKEKNEGLANSIIGGVTNVLDKYGEGIIIEDDLIVSKDFLIFMNESLSFYEKDKRVGAIGGFTPLVKAICVNTNGVLKSRLGCCLGWATWADRWKQVDWNINHLKSLTNKEKKKIDQIQYGFTAMLDQQAAGIIDSWAVRWDYHFFIHDWWTIYPNHSKVCCIGFDASSTHAQDTHDKRQNVSAICEESVLSDFADIPDVSEEMRKYFKPTVWEKIRYMLLIKKKRQ